jgi:hypothetical protein
MSGTEVDFGDGAVVTFDFERRVVTSTLHPPGTILASLEPAKGDPRKIQEFHGKVRGADFLAEMNIGCLSGNATLTVQRSSSAATARCGPIHFLYSFQFWEGLSCQYHELEEALDMIYHPVFESAAQVVGALLAVHRASSRNTST